jgi:membrane associated rhomboid family serine protease
MITILIIAITCIVSLITMNNEAFKSRFMFNAYAIKHHGEWWRFISHGLLHANFVHLLFNMISLYFFGRFAEAAFRSDMMFGPRFGPLLYLVMYLTALVASSIFTYFRQKDNRYYNALGASGAVAAVLFTYILLMPLGTIYIYAIPIPAWLYGALYLIYSSYMSKRGTDNIGHDAHLWGAIYGLLLPLLLRPELAPLFIAKIRFGIETGTLF